MLKEKFRIIVLPSQMSYRGKQHAPQVFILRGWKLRAWGKVPDFNA